MSRIMRKAVGLGTAINGVWTALAPGGGHKFEVLEVVVNTGATTGRQVVGGVLAGVTFLQTEQATAPQAFWVYDRVHNAIVVLEGEQFLVQVAGAGASPWDAMVTYMDVDFSD